MMERRIAMLFPGQGSQYVGMGKELWDQFPVARETFQEASEALREDLAGICFEGPEERLRLTANTQPAILTMSVATLRVIRSQIPMTPICAAGHSLGEYSALVAAGVLGFADAVALVRKRGQFMQESVPEGEGAMAALLGAENELVEALCRDNAGSRVVAPANFNGPGQVVISGHADAVERVVEAAKGQGVRKAVLLPVSAPFHSPLMAPAGDRLREELKRVPVGAFAFEVISNVEAAPYPSGEAVADLLSRQVSHPVRWQESMEAVSARGVGLALELGPKNVLAGLMKRIAPQVQTIPVEDRKGLDMVARLLS